MKIDNGYIYYNNNRVFINTSLGCKGACEYCYLPKIGYSKDNIDNNNNKSAEEILNEILKLKEIDEKTLISFGCFSECWDEQNKEETKKLIIHFLKKGNQIQLSTKKEININDMTEIVNWIKYRGQLVIFISSSTISNWKKLEKNTENPVVRFKSFELISKYNIPVILYLKPVIKNTTIKDINYYIEIIKKYKIKEVVIGSSFISNKEGEQAPFLNNKKLVYESIEDEKKIKNILKEYCNIFDRSTQVMKKYK